VNKINETLAEEITSLIDKKQEGGYWDFKLDWHDNKASLLHDIMCLANNIENRDAYLIFGVKDKNYEICGVSKDNRLNTVNVVNFLRDKKFVGNVRPTVRVETITVKGKELDILIIENSHYTPFRLSQDFKYESKKSDGKDIVKTVKAHNVYTRIQDTNTPIDKTADPDKEEKLWRKRFHIDEPAYNKAMYYLENPEDWERSEADLGDSYIISSSSIKVKMSRPSSRKRFYYKFSAEYSVDLVDEKPSLDNLQAIIRDVSWYGPNTKDGYIILKIYDSVLYAGYCDYYNDYRLVRPCRDSIKITRDNGRSGSIPFFYFMKDSCEDKLNRFLIDVQNNDKKYQSTWHKDVIIFNSEDEKFQFIEYIRKSYRECNDTLGSEIEQDNGVLCNATSRPRYEAIKFLRTKYDIWKGVH
jgi:putative abi-alpha protein